jgi:predicted RND superfamily exporter protein
MTSAIAKRMTRALVARRWWLAGAALVAVLATLATQSRIDFDRSIENMFSPSDPLLEPYRRLKRTFGGNEIVLAVYTDPGLLDPDRGGLQRVAEVSQRLERVPGVRSVLSLDRVLDESVDLQGALALRIRQLFAGYTHSADGRVAVCVCMLLPESETDVPRRETIDQLRAIMQQPPAGLAPGMITGEPVMLVDGFRYVEEDGIRLGRWSSWLLGLTILVCFRSLRWVLVCVAVVQTALLATHATLALLGLQLSMVSSMLTAVVTVVGVATVVHIIVRYREARSTGRGPLSAMVRTGWILAVPIFWACVTDAVGFASLVTARVGPVQDFGIMMGLGCLAVLCSVAVLVPALGLMPLPWALRQRSGASPQPAGAVFPPEAGGQTAVRRALARLGAWVTRHGRWIGIVACGLTGLALAGVGHLDVETDFTRNFRSDSQIVTAYDFVEEKLGGAGVCDIVIPAPANLDWNYLRRVRALESQIAEEPGLTKVLSLADAVVATAPQLESWSLLRGRLIQMGLAEMRRRIPSFYAALWGQDPQEREQRFLRVMLRARERQEAEQKKRLIRRLESTSRQYFPDAEVTGFYVLLTHLIDSVVRDQWRAFAVALVGIGLTMVLAFRSLRLALAALVPNGLPILVVSGVMGWVSWLGWLELKINMGSAMIAAVSLGLSIDSSIHYIFAFQRARRQGRSTEQAIEAAHSTVGLSMLLATLALIVGFSVLATSQFTPTVYFGCLVSLAMLGGLLGNLVILPLLLQWLEPR